VTDFPVLAKNTAQITPTEKDCSRPSPPPKHIFLTMMGTKTVNHGALAGATDGTLGGNQPINVTIPSAKVAALHVLKRLPCSCLKLSRMK
jgi:hypothetical protein